MPRQPLFGQDDLTAEDKFRQLQQRQVEAIEAGTRKMFNPAQYETFEENAPDFSTMGDFLTNTKDPAKLREFASITETRASEATDPTIKESFGKLSKLAKDYADRFEADLTTQEILKQPASVDLPEAEEKIGTTVATAMPQTTDPLKDLMARYKQAQEQASKGQQLESIMKSGESISRAIAGAGYTPTEARVVGQAGIGELYKTPLQNINQELAITPTMESMDQYDTGSTISQVARDSLKDMFDNLGMSLPASFDKLNYSQVTKLYPMLEPQIKAKAEAAKKSQEKQTKQEESLRKVQAELSDTLYKASSDRDVRKTARSLVGFDEKIRQLREYAENPKKVNSAQQIMEIYNIIKQLDQDSAVREGEIKMFLGASTFSDWVEANLSRVYGDNPKAIGSTTFRNLVKQLEKMSEYKRDEFNNTVIKPTQSLIKTKMEIYGIDNPEMIKKLEQQAFPYWDFERQSPKSDSPFSRFTTSQLETAFEKFQEQVKSGQTDPQTLAKLRELTAELKKREGK